MNYQEAIEFAEKHIDEWGEPRIPHFAKLRRDLANKSLSNPVTKVAERLAEPEVAEAFFFNPLTAAGENFLAEIHTEIDSVNKADLLRHVSSNPDDVIARIHLTLSTLSDTEEVETKREEDEELDFLLK